MTTLKLLPLIFWAILWTYWFISSFFVKKSIRKGRLWWRAVSVRLAIIVVVLAIYSARGGNFGNVLANLFGRSIALLPNSLWLSIIGVALCAIGITFAIWARAYLGKNWGMPMSLREKPELVTSGPYRLVRHPIYSGFLLAMFGTALVDGAIWLLAMILAGIYFIYSATVEEKMMLKEFPDQYPEYMKRSKMLIPFVL